MTKIKLVDPYDKYTLRQLDIVYSMWIGGHHNGFDIYDLHTRKGLIFDRGYDYIASGFDWSNERKSWSRYYGPTTVSIDEEDYFLESRYCIRVRIVDIESMWRKKGALFFRSERQRSLAIEFIRPLLETPRLFSYSEFPLSRLLKLFKKGLRENEDV